MTQSVNRKPGGPTGAPAGRRRARAVWLALHKWLGLTLGLWLAIVGLTGAMLVFHKELDVWLNPQVFRVTPPPGGLPHPPDAIVAAARAAAPEDAIFTRAEFPPGADRSYVFSLTINGLRGDEEWRLFVDPYTAAVTGRRLERAAGDIFPRAVVPFLFDLHYSLLLPARLGRPIAGYAALAALASCAVGLFLWWPARGKWRRALTIRPGASVERLTHDAHRSLGVYGWPILFTLLLSGASFNLPATFRAGVKLFSPGTEAAAGGAVDLAAGNASEGAPLSLATAMAVADRHTPGGRFDWFIAADALSSAHMLCKRGLSQVHRFIDSRCFVIDQNSGALLRVADAASGTRGDALLAWLPELHSGRAFGWPGRLAVFVMGLACPAILITGVMRWRHKRRARRLVEIRRTPARRLAPELPLSLAQRRSGVTPCGRGTARPPR